ncbi:diaminopimelate epimerase [Sulfuriflexus sp.]|uniref:diaminopimelate epimerase n=1 Tax=Sulfuriflexus sp. TaxID=2015443 RepID=UPI0028CD30BB|nr:diaminopimelate epimerase [Sulfuriflexus sp.]MDT8405008.1 diaminopimelate epimerase [Sulfuriflexus sp.]
MLLNFSKMHGLGNDFVVIDAINQSVSLDAALVRRLADRRRGIGCDQLLIVEPPREVGSEFYYRIYNADGSEVEQCGNGARCFARFVRDKGLSHNDSIVVDTATGRITLQIEASGEVTVNMGQPRFAPADLPLRRDSTEPEYSLNIDGKPVRFGAVSMGNPHAVLLVDDVATAPVAELGPRLESHPDFPNRVNVGFAEVIDREQIRLRVYERGAGETEACGTGACAAMVVARQQGLVDDKVRVHLRGGTLQISWAGDDNPVWMTGPATHVFDGQIEL